jgi:hypothetical protein
MWRPEYGCLSGGDGTRKFNRMSARCAVLVSKPIAVEFCAYFRPLSAVIANVQWRYVRVRTRHGTRYDSMVEWESCAGGEAEDGEWQSRKPHATSGHEGGP